MLGTEERGNVSTCLLQNRSCGTKRTIDACRMRQQAHLSARNQANRA
jgi:hypothetical protein